jgi:hypothetical protein
MASEVTKYSVFDPRIIQTKPKYAVEKGAQSLTNVSVQAQTADSSSCQFNVQVPSENVFVDRAVEWQGVQVATVTVKLTAANGTAIPANTPLQGLIATAAFPLHQSTTQMSATINDATVTVNTQDVLPQVLRLADLADARRQRTCPTMLDRYALYPDSRVVKNSPLLTWDQTKNTDEVPNGGFNGLYYATDASGGTPVDVTSASQVVGAIKYVYGQPTLNAVLDGSAGEATRDLVFYVAWASVEKLLLPPFIFADQDELSTGLFGVQNFQVQMNLTSPARAIRVSTSLSILNSAGAAVAPFSLPSAAYGAAWGAGAFSGPWVKKPSLAVQFLTPSLDVPLPPKSIVPYMEFPRYIATPGTAVPSSTSLATAGTQLVSQTITLPNIPDLLVIYVKPASYANSSNGDWSLPITNISVNFDNFSGLLSTMTQQQLYQMSVHNGVDMDWSEWTGYGNVAFSSALVPAGTIAAPASGGAVGLVGGPLVLRPGRDFALQAGQAPGLVGNFTLQFTITCQNFTGASQTPNIYTVPISSGFFETIKGSSRIIKGVLTEQDILSAPAHSPEADLERPVGAGRHGGAMGGAHGGRHGGAHGGMMGGRHGGAHGGRHGGAHGGMKAYM